MTECEDAPDRCRIGDSSGGWLNWVWMVEMGRGEFGVKRICACRYGQVWSDGGVGERVTLAF